MKFSYFEPVAGIIFAIIATIIFYFFPQIITIVFIGGRLIPTFDAEVIHSLWLPILIWPILRIIVETAYLIERRYTQRLAIISIVGNTLTVIVTCVIFASDRIVFWEYIHFVHTYFAGVAEWFGNILAKPNLIILVIIIVVLIIETANAVRKGILSKPKPAEGKTDDISVEEVKVDDISTADKPSDAGEQP